MVYKMRMHRPDHPSRQDVPDQQVAVVVGASGGLGAAFAAALTARRDIGQVFTLSRSGPRRDPAQRDRTDWITADVGDPASLAEAADAVRQTAPRVHLLINCSGILHEPGLAPEKALRQLEREPFLHLMAVNALVPLQVLAAFAPLLVHRERSVAATLSAMVGSIGDNRLGGWYSYRMSKAALNMGLKTAAIELARGRSGVANGYAGAPIVVAVHPGTTATPLSAPYLERRDARPAAASAARVLGVLDRLTPIDNGKFYNWDGRELPW
jgi:NAD(P)-dependent dehydrogenase (short-subunit alcohol dehydrogenase family)